MLNLELPTWLQDCDIEFMVFTHNDTYYVAPSNNHILESDLPFHDKLKHLLHDKRVVKLFNVLGSMEDSEHIYWFANADCAFPPIYLVSADSEGDAYAIFVTETDYCVIDDADLKDYNEAELEYNDDGLPIDSSSVVFGELKLVTIIFK